MGREQWDKRIQLLQQVLPQATRLGFLQLREAREKWGLPKEQSNWMGVSWVGPALNHPIDEAEFRRVFAGLIQDRAEGILVTDEDVHVTNVKLIVELAEKNRLPAIYPFKLFVEAGGLMSYGTDVSVSGDNIADIAGQILKGARPSEIPIRQPTKFELVINLKTAKALSLTVPAYAACRRRRCDRITERRCRLLAHHDRPPFSGRPSLTGYCGHGWTCRLPRPVAHDPLRKWNVHRSS